MAAEQQQQPENAEATPDSTSAAAKTRSLQHVLAFLRTNWVAAFICALLLIHLGLFAVWKWNSRAHPPAELTLGEFDFEGAPLPGSPVARAEFHLHVSLLDEARYRGRILLAERRHKLQQEIEELLRQAHGADFENPTLAELKRQIQAVINRTLGERVIDEVIITDLRLEHVAAAPPVDAPEPAVPTSWEEATSG
jgi:hypothetical protein